MEKLLTRKQKLWDFFLAFLKKKNKFNARFVFILFTPEHLKCAN